MGKRIHAENFDSASFLRKRQKVVHEAPTSEEVTSSRHLTQLLAFDQDLRNSRHGLQSFKVFLDQLASPDNAPIADNNEQLQLLKDYLTAVKPRDSTEDDAVFLPDIMEMWAFADQVYNEGIMSSVAVVIALLLHIMSQKLDLVPYALGICNTLLQDRQLKLIARNLSSDKSQAFIISPTLRMLREVVAMDGGAVSKRLFRSRQYTLCNLARNLEIKHLGDGYEEPGKASVRSNSVRFFLACLRYLPAESKRELLVEKHAISHLTFLLQSDPPYLIRDILASLKQYVLLDDKVPKDVKFRTFNTKTLTRFLALYNSSYADDGVDGVKPVGDLVHEFMLLACTDPVAGLLYPSRGLYPKDMAEDHSLDRESAKADLGRVFWLEKYRDQVPVVNFVLSELTQKLRPWASIKHSELLIAMFQTAPELISHYFVNSKSFTFEPKLSMTWIGYASFLFSTIQIPLPRYFGAKAGYSTIPPPTSVLLDNILPLPITQKVVTRCLSTDSQLTAFFATRLLVIALEKLKQALDMHQQAKSSFGGNSALWSDGRRRLVDEFCQRIPDLKDVVRSYKSIPEDNVLHRAAATQLLLLYYEVIPQVALVLNLDVSPFVTTSLQALQTLSVDTSSSSADPSKNLAYIELQNLISIASYSPGMRWFSKSEGASLSPFVSLLKTSLTRQSSGSAIPPRLQQVLEFVAVENQLLVQVSGLNPLQQAIGKMHGHTSTTLDYIWTFLDNCVGRCTSSPIKYLEMLQQLSAESKVQEPESAVTSLLAFSLIDQVAFAVKSWSTRHLTILANFVTSYLDACVASGEHRGVLQILNNKLASLVPAAFTDGSELHKAPRSTQTNKTSHTAPQNDASENDVEMADAGDESPTTYETAIKGLESQLFTAGDTSALTRWTLKSVDDLIEEGYATALIRLLLSEHVHIRKEALTNILKMATKIRQSSHEAKEQIWLLVSELAESCRELVPVSPVPSFFPAFAVHGLEVLRNPLHSLYGKVNTALTRGPIWLPDRLPVADDIFHGEPSEDDRYYGELVWLLTYLLDSLCTAGDLAVFHKKRVFEKVLAVGGGNPFLRIGLRMRVLRILYRATCIEGGSTTLATRFGIFSWLEARIAACGNSSNNNNNSGSSRGLLGKDGGRRLDEAVQQQEEEELGVLKALVRRTWDTCDQERVRKWSKGGVEKLVERLEK